MKNPLVRPSAVSLTAIFRLQVVAITLATLFASMRNLQAAPVSFWFSGVIDYMEINSEGLPLGINYGTPFCGYLFYNSTGYTTANTNSVTADYYFPNTTAFKMVLQVGGHTFSTSNSVSGSSGYIGVQNNFTARDNLDFSSANSRLLMDGAPFYFTNSGLALQFSDNTMTALSSAAIPANPPTTAMFPLYHRVGIGASDNDNNNQVFWVTGTITNITSIEQVQLNIRRGSNGQLQVSWPIVANGFTLQSRTNFTNDVWQDVAMPVVDTYSEHTVTLPSSKARQFFRLRK